MSTRPRGESSTVSTRQGLGWGLEHGEHLLQLWVPSPRPQQHHAMLCCFCELTLRYCGFTKQLSFS